MKSYYRLWQVWRRQSINRQIFSAIITVGGLTLIVRLASVGKELVLAHQFGVGDLLDAFLIAFLLPSLAVNVIAASFNTALLPTYLRVRAEAGEGAAQQLFSSVMVWSIGLLLVTMLVLALAAPLLLQLLGSGFSDEKLALTHSLAMILLPILLISGLSAIWTAILNAGERFSLGAVAPVAIPLLTVFAILTIGSAWGIYALALGTLSGYLLEAILLGWGLKRRGILLIPRWHGMSPALRHVISQYLPMVAGAFMMSGTLLVDQAMAAMLPAGSVSVLNYGNKIVAFVLGIAAMALGTAVFPHFSRMVALQDWTGIRHTLKTYGGLILLITLPFTALLIYFSETLVRLLFERGAFTPADTVKVGLVQAYYLLQIPFYILGIMGVRLLSAMHENRVLMWISLFNLTLNIVANYWLMNIIGVAGIALSTSIVYLASTLLISYAIFRKLRAQGELSA